MKSDKLVILVMGSIGQRCVSVECKPSEKLPSCQDIKTPHPTNMEDKLSLCGTRVFINRHDTRFISLKTFQKYEYVWISPKDPNLRKYWNLKKRK
jgi:hypothetical protein